MAYRFEPFLIHDYNLTFRVYKILDSIGRIKYIGCTTMPLGMRFSGHKHCTSNKKTGYYYFFKAVKEGMTTATIELIQEFDNPFEASELESSLIESFGNLLNRKRMAVYAQKSSIEKYNWIMKRGGKTLLEKFRVKVIKRHFELCEKWESYYGQRR